MLVKEIMNRNIIYVSADTPVKEIFKIMINLDTSFLPVLDSEKNIIGYILEKNLLSRMKLYKAEERKKEVAIHLDHHAFIKEQRKLYGSTAKDIMETDLMAVDEHINIADVVELMLNKNIFRFPVLRKNKIVGFVTSHDILEALYHLEEGRKLEELPISDEDLKYKIYSAVKSNLDVRISRLNVHVKNGAVHILGSVDSKHDYKAVEDIVKSLPEVKSVSNSLMIDHLLD